MTCHLLPLSLVELHYPRYPVLSTANAECWSKKGHVESPAAQTDLIICFLQLSHFHIVKDKNCALKSDLGLSISGDCFWTHTMKHNHNFKEEGQENEGEENKASKTGKNIIP